MRALGRIRVGWSGSGSELKRLRHFASVKRSSSSPQHFDRPSDALFRSYLNFEKKSSIGPGSGLYDGRSMNLAPFGRNRCANACDFVSPPSRNPLGSRVGTKRCCTQLRNNSVDVCIHNQGDSQARCAKSCKERRRLPVTGGERWPALAGPLGTRPRGQWRSLVEFPTLLLDTPNSPLAHVKVRCNFTSASPLVARYEH